MRVVGWWVTGVTALVGCSSSTPANAPRGGSGSARGAAVSREVAIPAPGAVVAIGPPRFSLGVRPERIAFSHDGTKVAACGRDGYGRIWDVATGAPIATMTDIMHCCTALAWMPGDAHVAIAGVVNGGASHTAIRVVDTEGRVRASSTIDGGDGVHSLLPIDERTVAVGITTGYGMLSLDAPAPIEELRWSYDGRHGAIRGSTAAVANDATIVVRRADRDVCAAPVDRSSVEALEVSADERQVTVFHLKGTDTIDTTTCAVIGHGPPAAPLAPDGRTVTTTAFGFDVIAANAAPPPEHREDVVAVAIANDATITTASDDAVITWRDRGRRGVALSARTMFAPEIDPGGTQVAGIVVEGGGARVDVIELGTGKVVRHALEHTPSRVAWLGTELLALGPGTTSAYIRGARRPIDRDASWIAASPDGVRQLHLQEPVGYRTRHLALYIGDESRGEIGEDAYGVRSAAVGATRMVVVSARGNRETRSRYTLAAYEVPSREAVELPAAMAEGGSAVALLHASDTIVAGTSDGTIVVWDGTTTRTRQTPAGRIVAIAVSPDDKLVATVHAGGEIYAWELAAIE